MREDGTSHMKHMSSARALRRIDKMVASERVTEEEAERLRAAAEAGDVEAEARTVRLRHLQVKVDDAVGDGRLSQEEAADVLKDAEDGRHPVLLRKLLRK